MHAVAILDHNPAFALGLGLLVDRSGVGRATIWSDVADARQSMAGQRFDLHLVSMRLLEPFRALKGGHAAPLILLIDAGDLGSLGQTEGVHFDGLLLRDACEQRIIEGLRTVVSGHAWIDPVLCSGLGRPEQNDWRCLSERELQIATLTARGLSNKQIARALGLTYGTVKIHLHHIFAKLHLSRRCEIGPLLDLQFAPQGTASATHPLHRPARAMSHDGAPLNP